MKPPLIYLSDAEAALLLPPVEAYQIVKDALICHEHGDCEVPLKVYLRPRGREEEHIGGRFIAMPASVGGEYQIAGMKWISGFPSNVERGLPRASGLILLNSKDTGCPLAVIECATLSARRTAAVTALAVDELASPTNLRMALLGAGPINKSVLQALAATPRQNLVEIRLYDLKNDRAEQLAAEAKDLELPPLIVCDSAKSSVEGANVVICATTGSTGYLQKEWLQPGWLIIALSLDDATPELFLSADRVIVDDFDQCCREEKLIHRLVKDGRFSLDQVAARLGEVLLGKKSGRKTPDENVYVNPMGLAIEDIAVSAVVYRKAVAQGIGQVLSN